MNEVQLANLKQGSEIISKNAGILVKQSYLFLDEINKIVNVPLIRVLCISSLTPDSGRVSSLNAVNYILHDTC